MNIPHTLQSLPSSVVHLCLSVEKFIKEELQTDLSNKNLLIALSGGVDSTALLLIFFFVKQRLSLNLSVAHLNHGLRPSAQEEAIFCEQICSEINIPFYSSTVSVPELCKKWKCGTEEAARKARYSFFSDLHTVINYDWIVLGHHLNDLAEDCLMRLIRGAGWPSIGGMSGIDYKRKILRPLLFTPRKKLENFLCTLNIPHVEDESNYDKKYFRNRVRIDFLPLFEKENPAFLNTVKNLWKMARIDENMFENMLSSHCSFCKSEDEKNIIRKETLMTLPRSLRLRLYKYVLEHAGSGHAQFKNLIALDDAWLKKRSGITIQFPRGKSAYISKGNIILK